MSDDLISRQAVLKIIDGWYEQNRDTENIEDLIVLITYMDSVNPQEPETGHWIEKDGFDGDVYYDCSECGESWTTIEGTPWDNEWDYCPSCGCRMVESQERSDKE